MTKAELVKQSIEWKIADCEKEIEELKHKIKVTVESDNTFEMASFLPQYSMKLQEVVAKYRELHEQKKAIEFIIND